MSVGAWMPWFFGDYLKDTGDLTLEEHGAYMMLLGHLWGRGGTLPADHERLARILGVDRLTMERLWLGIGRFFSESEGLLMQKRLSEELDKAKERQRLGSAAGKASAAARSAQRKLNGLGNGTATEDPTESQRNTQRKSKSSPSPSPSPEDPDPPKPPKGGDEDESSDFVYPEDFEAFWAVTNKKGSKYKACLSWKKLGKPSSERLIASWRKWQLTDDEWRRGFEKHPISWLNGRMHEQEPSNGARSPPPEPKRDVVKVPPDFTAGGLYDRFNT